MQARTIILADHSGTAQAETHSQRFYISGQCGGISSVTCCLWLVNTQCVFSSGTPNNRGKISEHCMDMRVVLEGAHFFFLAEPGGCSLNWEWLLRYSANKLLKMWQRKKKCGKEWRSSDKWCGLLHHLKVCVCWGGIIQAPQIKFRRWWKTNTASRLQCDS